MQQLDNTYQLQHQLGNFCRTGKNKPVTDKPENTDHYRRLVFNIVEDILSTAFPLSKALLKDKKWNDAVTHFFELHACSTTQIWKLSAEFHAFYKENPFPFKNKYPFLSDLLLFEYKEIEIFMMEDILSEEYNTEGNMAQDILIPNPEIQILSLEYPVHIKKANEIKDSDKSNYFVSIHRNFKTKDVQFNELSYPFVEIIAHLNEKETTLADALSIYSKYEKDNKEAKRTIVSFILFAIENNIIQGYKNKK